MSPARSPFRVGADALLRAEARNLSRWAAVEAALAPAAAIWCTGLGKSGLVARKLAATLSSFGRPAHFLHPVEALHGDAGALGEADAIVAISASGHTAELIRLLHNQPLPLVSVAPLGSPLTNLASAALDAGVEEEAGGDAPITSYLVATALVDALALRLRPGSTLIHPGGFLGLRGRSVRNLMRAPPLVAATASVASCIPFLIDGAVLIVGGGIFTDGDLRRVVGADPGVLQRPVGEVCTREPVTVGVEEPASHALDRMERRDGQLAVLPVVDDAGAYVGLLRLHDLVRAGMGA